MFLKEAELSKNGTMVIIRCVFADDYPEASCVLIYRKYNNPFLTVVEYNHNTSFPVSETMDDCSDSERCTFSLFGKNGVSGIEEEPVIRVSGTYISAIIRYIKYRWYLWVWLRQCVSKKFMRNFLFWFFKAICTVYSYYNYRHYVQILPVVVAAAVQIILKMVLIHYLQ